MPAVLAKYDPNDKDINALADKERLERQRLIEDNWRWYDGDHPDTLKVESGEKNDNLKFNLTGRSADKGVEFIQVPKRYELPGNPDFDTVSADQEALNELYSLYQDQFDEQVLDGWVGGHVFWKLFFDGDMPAMALIDPRYLTVFWEQNRGSRARALWYRMRWTVGEKEYMQDIVPRWLTVVDKAEEGELSGWLILDYEQIKGSNRWELTDSDPWDYDFPPMVEVRNKRRPHKYYGVPQITKSVTALNYGINFVASNTGRIIKFHAHPRTIGVGVDPASVNTTSIDGFFTIPEGAEVKNLEMQSDLQSSMEFQKKLETELFASVRVVDTAAIKDKLGAVTNFGLRQIYNDQVEMSEDKRKSYGEGMGEALRRMLVMAGYAVEKAPVAVWGEMLPTNRLELLQAAQIEKNLGTTSDETLAQEIGRDYDAEQQKLADEKTSAGAALTDVLSRAGERGMFN
jgi:hypothetical protein